MKRICVRCGDFEKCKCLVQYGYGGSWQRGYAICLRCFNHLSNKYGDSDILTAVNAMIEERVKKFDASLLDVLQKRLEKEASQ